MRRRRAEQRPVPPDVKYGSVDLTRFINKVMERGKKTVAQGIVYGALDVWSGRRAALRWRSSRTRCGTPSPSCR